MPDNICVHTEYFTLDADGFAWLNNRANCRSIRSARQALVLSLGCCSFDKPLTTTSLLGLGLLGGWARPNWLRVLAIAAVLMATIVWIGRRARLRGAKPIYVYASAVINLAASTAIVMITGGARSPFWLLFLIGAITSTMSFRGRAGVNLELLNTGTAALALLTMARKC